MNAVNISQVYTSVAAKTLNLVNGTMTYEFFDSLDMVGINTSVFSNGSYVAYAVYWNMSAGAPAATQLFLTVVGQINKAYV